MDGKPGAWVTAQARGKALAVWMFAGLLLALALASVALVRWNPAPIVLSLLVVVLVLGVRRVAERRADDAIRWHKGATAETSVGEELNALRAEGFTVLHDVEQRGEGNIDHLVSGPAGVFLVETKWRRYESHQLVKAKRQAAKLHAELGTWITPVICLHLRKGSPFRAQGVWVVPQPALLDWIRAQRNTRVSPARFDVFVHGL